LGIRSRQLFIYSFAGVFGLPPDSDYYQNSGAFSRSGIAWRRQAF
jgi:hypothetical protein